MPGTGALFARPVRPPFLHATEQESKFYALSGARSGVNAKVCPRANQSFGAIKISAVMLVVVKQNEID